MRRLSTCAGLVSWVRDERLACDRAGGLLDATAMASPSSEGGCVRRYSAAWTRSTMRVGRSPSSSFGHCEIADVVMRSPRQPRRPLPPRREMASPLLHGRTLAHLREVRKCTYVTSGFNPVAMTTLQSRIAELMRDTGAKHADLMRVTKKTKQCGLADHQWGRRSRCTSTRRLRCRPSTAIARSGSRWTPSQEGRPRFTRVPDRQSQVLRRRGAEGSQSRPDSGVRNHRNRLGQIERDEGHERTMTPRLSLQRSSDGTPRTRSCAMKCSQRPA